MTLAGLTAVVSGGASGLGLAAATALHHAGMSVALLDRSAEAAESAAASLGERAGAWPVDVTDPEAVSAALAEVAVRWGGPHVAVSCAGIAAAERLVGRGGPHDVELFTKVIAVNLVGTFNLARAAAALMARNEVVAGFGRGLLVHTASIAAFDGQSGQLAYAASKGAIAAMTLPIARDMARHAVRCVTIAPGVFATPMVAGLTDEVRAGLRAIIPYPAELGRPEHFGLLVRQIAENPYLNGEVIRLDAALRMPA